MKKFCTLLVFAFFGCYASAQSLIGAWETVASTENGDKIRMVAIFTEGYHVLTTYEADNGKFISTQGGSWTLEGDLLTEFTEFNSESANAVGTEKSFTILITATTLEITALPIKFNRIDDGKPGALEGAWLMSGRIVEGKMQNRETNGPRKTMKILSGTRFQWIAYNTESKEFMGTGGGTYTTENGIYSETIEFFSKDHTKVGAILKFNYSINEGKWSHRGFSTKGDPIHEIWSLR